jgi:hypothetical protein
VPTRFVGVHLSVALVIAAFGLSFLADPCSGGGDLCLGGVVGLFALGAAGLGGLGIVIWLVARRASPLLVWDSALVVIAGAIVIGSGGIGEGLFVAGALAVVLLALGGAVLAGREVAIHRIERIVAVVALAATVVEFREGGFVIVVVGLVALFVGWRMGREDIGQVA